MRLFADGGSDPVERGAAPRVLAGLACLLAGLSSCTGGRVLPGAVDPQDCAALPAQDWAVGGYLFTPESEVAVGKSLKTSLAPALEDHCEGAVARVVWHVDDPAVASILPAGRSAWVTGLAPGATAVGARVVFASGSEAQARSRLFRVVPAAPATGSLVAEGELTIPPYLPPGTVDSWRGWVTFKTGSPGRIDVAVDWSSALNRIDFSGYEGRCAAVGTCGRIVMTVRETGVKPLTATFDNPRMPAGEYTIRIDNLGPGEETVRYEVRLAPS